jgi:hypothetical protein
MKSNRLLTLVPLLPALACASTAATSSHSADAAANASLDTSIDASVDTTSASDAAGDLGHDLGDNVLSCETWYRHPIAGTDAVLVNNVWNEQWAGDKPHSQCLLQRPKADGSTQYGWRWDWPAYKPYTSYAAPEALIGWKAWDGGKSTLASLPRRVDALSSLNVDFAVDIKAAPTYNLNTTMWITATDVATASPNPSDIRNEIMVWFANPAGLGGGITYDGAVTLAGIQFDVWHLVNNPDASGGSTQKWTMIIYAARDNRQAASFDLKLVLDDCVSKGLVDPTHAVGGVELITEIFGGKGELWLDRFGVAVK